MSNERIAGEEIYKGNVKWGFIDIDRGDIELAGPNRCNWIQEIDTPFSFGRISALDPFGMNEMLQLYSHCGSRRLFVSFHPVQQDGSKNYFRFECGLYDSSITLDPVNGPSNPNAKEISYTLSSEPIYSALHKRVISKAYKQKKLSEIIKDILLDANEGVGWDENYLDIYDFKPDPIIPLFIIPNWNPHKALKYLSNYAPGGPLKIFLDWDAFAEKSYLCVYPLSALMKGELGKGGTFYVATSQTRTDTEGNMFVDPHVMRPGYVVLGPGNKDPMSHLGGESLINFDYFCGTEEKNWGDVVVDKGASYEFQTPDKTKTRNYMTPIGGNYKQGAGRSTRLGDTLLYEVDKRSGVNLIMSEKLRTWSIDNEAKPLVEYKMQNRFYDKFSNQIVIKAVLPPTINLKIGYTYELVIPSFSTQADGSYMRNRELSGTYLLSKIEHKLAFLQTTSTGDLNYECEVTFIKTGLDGDSYILKKAEKVEASDIIESPLAKTQESDTAKDFKERMSNVRKNNIYKV